MMQNTTTKNHSSSSPPLSQVTLFCDEQNDDKNWFLNDFDDYYDPLTNFIYTTKFPSKKDSIFEEEEEEEEDDEYIRILLESEINSSFIQKHDQKNYAATTGAYVTNSSRNHAINYILHMAAVFGFQLQTAYLSLCYLDSFLSKRSIFIDKTWAIQLLTVACLSIAAKMEENRVPSLSDFLIGNFKFDLKYVQKMELLVLDTLEWKMGIVTSLAYLPCFFNKFCDQPPSQVTSSLIIKLILAFMKEIDLMDHHQYAIASASILVALDQSLSKEAIELKINTISFSRLLDIDDIFTCYNIMVPLFRDKNKVLNLPDSPDQSPIHVLHDTGTTSSICIKRKSLTFDDYELKIDDLSKKSRCCS